MNKYFFIMSLFNQKSLSLRSFMVNIFSIGFYLIFYHVNALLDVITSFLFYLIAPLNFLDSFIDSFILFLLHIRYNSLLKTELLLSSPAHPYWQRSILYLL